VASAQASSLHVFAYYLPRRRPERPASSPDLQFPGAAPGSIDARAEVLPCSQTLTESWGLYP